MVRSDRETRETSGLITSINARSAATFPSSSASTSLSAAESPYPSSASTLQDGSPRRKILLKLPEKHGNGNGKRGRREESLGVGEDYVDPMLEVATKVGWGKGGVATTSQRDEGSGKREERPKKKLRRAVEEEEE
ncbi:hypothetical protein BT69DRAFT_1265302, partial [Atractiella rhizophila]